MGTEQSRPPWAALFVSRSRYTITGKTLCRLCEHLNDALQFFTKVQMLYLIEPLLLVRYCQKRHTLESRTPGNIIKLLLFAAAPASTPFGNIESNRKGRSL